MKKTFILSDDSVNSYGYRVITAGGDFALFRRNPVMLYSHQGERLPIGTWENLRVDGERLLADALFDSDDPFAAEVERKVERGIIRCCSIGFDVLEVSDDEVLKLERQSGPTVTRWQLLECSICAVGANPNAKSLAAGEGERLHLKAGQRMTLSTVISPIDNNNSINPQKQTTMPNQENQELQQARQALADLRQQNEQLAAEVGALRQAAQQARDNEINGLLTAAIADGRLSEADRPHWDKLMHADLDSARAALATLSTRASLSQALSQQGGKSPYAGKSWNELDRAGLLAAMKEAEPEAFRQLYKQTFGAEYVG